MKKILFIEDESALHKALGEILKQEGYEMVSAFDGEAGLEMAEKEKPDFILLDLVLPKIHGFDVLKELKKNEETKDIPVIILTNLENMQDVEKSIKMGAKGYLVKSGYTLEEVVEKIKKIIEGK
jgi:DNA-binding response OmpR family regulator